MDVTEPLEGLFEVSTPSALSRRDEALTSGGVAPADLAKAKDALAAVGLATTEATARGPGGSLKDRLLASVARDGRYGVFADRLARAQNYSTSAPISGLTLRASSDFSADLALAFGIVPEPGSLACLAFGLFSRRLRREVSIHRQ